MAKKAKKPADTPAAKAAAPAGKSVEVLLARDWTIGERLREKGERLCSVALEDDVHFAFVARAILDLKAAAVDGEVTLTSDMQVGDRARKAGERLCAVQLDGVGLALVCQLYLDSMAVIPKPAS